jgi:hypothetical protein
MNKFQAAKIYAIKSPSFDKVYIGSTTQPLSIRFSEHKSHYKRYLAGKRNYTSSYALIKLDDAYIELLQECKCDTKRELLAEEAKQMLAMKDKIVNILIPGGRKPPTVENTPAQQQSAKLEEVIVC